MIKKLISLIVILNVVNSFQISDQKQCLQLIKDQYSAFMGALLKQNTNAAIDDITSIALHIPQVLSKCNQEQLQKLYIKQFPTKCINDLNKGAKLLANLINQSDNQVKFMKDSTMLQLLFKMRIKKDCPFAKDVSPNQLKAGGLCFESIYQLSLIIQKGVDYQKSGDKAKAYQQFGLAFKGLPKTLQTCGYWNLAQTIRKDFPPQCINAINQFGLEISKVLHNYMHIQWLAKHYKEIIGSFRKLQSECPAF